MRVGNLKAVYGVVLLSVFALAVVLLLTSGLRAQGGDSEWQRARLERTWRVQLTARDCQTGAALRAFPAVFIFAKGGTLTATTAGQSPAPFTPNLGVWRHTGGNTYSAVPRPSFLALPESGYRRIGSLGPSSSVTTRTSSPIPLSFKSSAPIT